MNRFGLKLSDIDCILEVLKRYPEVDEAILFGSRAMSRQKKGSDIEIALKCPELDFT